MTNNYSTYSGGAREGEREGGGRPDHKEEEEE